MPAKQQYNLGGRLRVRSVGDGDRREIVLSRGVRVVVRGDGVRDVGDDAPPHRHLPPGPCRDHMVVEAAASAIGGVGAFSTYVRINKCRVIRDTEGAHRAAKLGCTVAAPYTRAPIGGILREVPGGQGVVGVYGALPRLVLYCDGAAGSGPAGREIEYDTLGDGLVFGVVRVVRVEDAVDPAVRTIRGRARQRSIGALLEDRNGGLSWRGSAGGVPTRGAAEGTGQPEGAGKERNDDSAGRNRQPARPCALPDDAHITFSLMCCHYVQHGWPFIVTAGTVMPGGMAFRITLPVWTRHYLFLSGRVQAYVASP